MALTALQQANVNQAAPSGQASLTALYESENSPSQGASVPTAAPSGQTSTSAPAASPVSVVSSGTATNHINNTVVPAMNNANTAITNQNTNNQNNSQTPPPTPPTPPATPPSASDQAATNIANTPDAGNQFAYSTADGSRIQTPINQTIPNGYSSTDYKNALPTSSVSDTTGTGLTYKQFSDGTYGRYDINGNYIGQATQAEYQNVQDGEAVAAKLAQIVNGTYPLTANQQSQIDGIKAQFQELITQQTVANNNFTGGTTVAQNLYGIGNTSMGTGAIKDSVDQGVAKIADLQSKMSSAVAQMTDSFQNQNYTEMKGAYDDFANAQKEVQATINDIQTKALAAAKDARDTNYNEITKPIQDIATELSKDGAPQSVINAVLNTQDVSTALKVAGDNLQTATGQLGDYLEYKRNAVANKQTPEDYATWKIKDDAQTAKEKASEAYGTAFATAKGKAAGEAAAAGSGTGVSSPVTSPQGVIYNAPADIAPYVSFSANGVKYVDLSNFKGTPTEANKAVSDAQAAGYKVITNKNTALDVQNITDASAKLADMQKAFDGANTGNAAERDSYNAGLMWAAKALQTNPDAVGTDVYQDTALDILKAMSGVQGFRGGSSMIESVRTTFPNTNDTQAVVDQKIGNIQKLIDDRQTALVGKPSASDQTLIDTAQAKTNINNYVTQNPADAPSIAKLYNVPGATDASVYQYLKQSGKLQ